MRPRPGDLLQETAAYSHDELYLVLWCRPGRISSLVGLLFAKPNYRGRMFHQTMIRHRDDSLRLVSRPSVRRARACLLSSGMTKEKKRESDEHTAS